MKMFFAELEFRKGLLFENSADAMAFVVAVSKAQLVERKGYGPADKQEFYKLDEHPIQEVCVTNVTFVERVEETRTPAIAVTASEEPAF